MVEDGKQLISKRQTKSIFERNVEIPQQRLLRLFFPEITQKISGETNLRSDNQMVKNQRPDIQLSKTWLISNTKFAAYQKLICRNV